MSGHSPDHRPISEVLYCHCRPGHCDCTDARVAAAEMNAVFDLRWKADRRATEAWQAAHPGNDLVWPDHADMVTWLLERDAILRAAAQDALSLIELQPHGFTGLNHEIPWFMHGGISHGENRPDCLACQTEAALRAALGDER